MKKFKFYLTWMGLMMALGVMAQPAGNGSKESPFLLGTAEDMSWFRTYVYDTDAKACAKLTADIDLSSAGTWMGIGTEMRPYQGVFDGDGHRIKGVNMNFANVNQDNVGLFGCARYAVVKNLSVSGTAVAGMVAGGSIASGVSLLMGRGEGVTVSHVSVSGNIAGYGRYVGGVVGLLTYSPVIATSDERNRSFIADCVNYASVTGLDFVGGIVGDAFYASPTLERCANRGQVHATGVHAVCGGVTSRLHGKMLHCANMERVVGMHAVGGVVGSVAVTTGSGNSQIVGCYNSAQVNAVEAESMCGLLVGERTNEDFAPIMQGNIVNGLVHNVEVQNARLLAYGLTELEGVAYVGTDDMADGEVAYILQGDYDDEAWGQRLGTDAVPSLCTGAPRVYLTGKEVNCKGEPVTDIHYSNTRDEEKMLDHVFDEDGLCTICGYSMALVQDEDGYYLIGNAAQFDRFRKLFVSLTSGTVSDLNVRLTADIDLSSLKGYHSLNLMDDGSNLANVKWGGVLDGQGHKIVGARFSRTGLLRGIVGGKVMNLHLYGQLSDANYSGMITQRISDGAYVMDCTVHGSIKGAGSYVGGLIERAEDAKSYVLRCANYTDITTMGSYVGGVVAIQNTYLTICDCANYGTITAADYVGGIFGYGAGNKDTDYGFLSAGDIVLTGTGSNCGPIASQNTVYANRCVVVPSITISMGGDAKTAGVRYAGQDIVSRDVTHGEAACYLDCGHDVWGQELGVDPLPVLGGMVVYSSYPYDCKGDKKSDELIYVNSLDDAQDAHEYDADGICTVCQALQPSVQDDDGYYLIANAGNLRWWGDLVAADGGLSMRNARQVADVDLSHICHPAIAGKEPVSWVPIGRMGNWCGVYDGNNHTVRGLFYSGSSNRAGLFSILGKRNDAYASRQACIKNLTVVGEVTVIDTQARAGAYGAALVCGYVEGGSVENCVSRGSVTSATSYVGGIVGNSRSGVIIKKCTNYASITQSCTYDLKEGMAGGVIGNSGGPVIYCSNYGHVVSNRQQVGGIAGVCTGNNTLTFADSSTETLDVDYGMAYCGNYGKVEGMGQVGGIAGLYAGTLPVYSCIDCEPITWPSSVTEMAEIATFGPILGALSHSEVTVSQAYYVQGTYAQSISAGIGVAIVSFNNGSVAHRMGEPWGQDLEGGDVYPVLFGPKVYRYNNLFTNHEGDLDCSGKVSIADVSEWVKSPVDLNEDGKADIEDLHVISDKVLEKK